MKVIKSKTKNFSAVNRAGNRPSDAHQWVSKGIDHRNQDDAGAIIPKHTIYCNRCLWYILTEPDNEEWRMLRAPFPCRRVHLQDARCQNPPQAICGYSHTWKTPRSDWMHFIASNGANESERRRRSSFDNWLQDDVRGQQPKVNCPDCLFPAMSGSTSHLARLWAKASDPADTRTPSNLAGSRR